MTVPTTPQAPSPKVLVAYATGNGYFDSAGLNTLSVNYITTLIVLPKYAIVVHNLYANMDTYVWRELQSLTNVHIQKSSPSSGTLSSMRHIVNNLERRYIKRLLPVVR